MFTLKHVLPGGNEAIYQSLEVQFTDGLGLGKGGDPESPQTVWFTAQERGEIRPLTGGTVYVMNGEGKTVAVYRLDGGPEA